MMIRKNKSKYAICALILIVFFIIFLEIVSYSCKIQIVQYEKMQLLNYSDNEFLLNLEDRDAYLDVMEKYISENRFRLCIMHYERNDNNIVILFFGGMSYLINALVQGYD